MSTPLPKDAITGVVLAGGRGARMGGVDKGLELFNALPLAQHSLRRLAPQVGATLVNANRHLEAYAALGAPVWPDSAALEDYAGPLAGFLTALEHCQTPYLVTVPCDTPLLPLDLVARLAQACSAHGADMAMARGPDQDGAMRLQPVFCLMHTRVLDSLRRFTASGARRIDAWTAQHACEEVTFDLPGDDPHSFFNANTLAELRALEAMAPTPPA